MPKIVAKAVNYTSPSWLFNGHLQTIYGHYAARRKRVYFVRERINTTDGDFIDLDWAASGLVNNQPDPSLSHTAACRWATPADWQHIKAKANSPALLLLHGLEGSSQSHYSQAITSILLSLGWLVVVAHFRGCSGFPNLLARAYYSGDIADTSFIVKSVLSKMPQMQWHLAGVSLGGNTLLRYLASRPHELEAINASAAICAPTDMLACGMQLSKNWVGRHIYTRHFLRSIMPKIQAKDTQFPHCINGKQIQQARTLQDFDNAYTAPIHGYKNALDYWTKASSKPHLKQILVPTLILNSLNDPFIPKHSLPEATDCSNHIRLHYPHHGGHVGFVSGPFPGHLDWLGLRLAHYFKTRT